MRDGHRVVDADGHVMEPADLWDKYLDRSFYDRRPIANPASVVGMTVEGHYMPRGYAGTDERATAYESKVQQEWRETFRLGFDSQWSVQFFLDTMDAEGIDAMVLYPSRGLYVTAIDGMDPELASAINRAYSRWLADFCSAAPDRLIGVALASLQDPTLAAKDATYGVAELGLKGVMIRPNPMNGRNLEDRSHDEFFATVAGLGVPLATHEGSGAFVPQYGDRYESRIGQHAFSHTVEQMGAVYGLTVGGVFARHPTLRAAILETGAGWLPFWLDRLDEHCEFLNELHVDPEQNVDTGDLTMMPSEYFRRQGWISAEPTEPNLRGLVDYVGADKLLWASDFPHADCTYPGMVDNLWTARDQGLTDSELGAYVGQNAIELYQI
jgi:predicted TIM-barrel fold metal-dependent hydrolase